MRISDWSSDVCSSYLITLEQYKRLLQVAQKLTAQHDIARLCEIILEEARSLTRADGGTLYLVEGIDDKARLEFAIVRNRSLGLRLGEIGRASCRERVRP